MRTNFVESLRSSLIATWDQSLKRTKLWQDLKAGNCSEAQYAAFLRETYHYTRRSSLIQASALPHFQEKGRELARTFLKHALEEESHFRLCMNDLTRLGYSTSAEDLGNPLPMTEGYIGFIFNRINFVSPYSYLGYLYNLELLAITVGPEAAAMFRQILGEKFNSSSSFLRVHAAEDQDHVAELEELLAQVDENQHDTIRYTATTAARLYALMVDYAHAHPWNKS